MNKIGLIKKEIKIKYIIPLFFITLFSCQTQDKKITLEEMFVWNYAITTVSSYEYYVEEFEKNKRDSLLLDIEEIEKKDLLEADGKYYIIRKPEPSFKEYIIWLNNWIKQNEEYYLGNKRDEKSN